MSDPAPCLGAAALACALMLSTSTAALAAPAIAILPTAGDSPKDQRQKLDAALRKAVVADGSYVVQDAKETQEQIAFMAEQGTICVAGETACLQRLGILCDVQYLLIPESTGNRELTVSLTLLNAEDALVVRTVDGAVNLATNSSAKLVDTALHGGDEPEAPPPPPPKKVDPLEGGPTPGPTDPNQPVDETELNSMQFAGAATAGVAGGLGALALLSALGGEGIYWSGGGGVFNKDARIQIGQVTRVLWGVTAVGLATAGVGVGVFIAGAPAEEKSIDSP